jgi:F-type H+-transporting ATPase subunit b
MLVAGDALASEDLVLFPDWRMLGLLVAIFGLLVFPVNALIFKPIFRVLDERDAKIVGTREKAERMFADAEEVLSRYETSVREVRAEAEQARKQVLEAARSVGSANTAEARGEAEREVAGAREEVASALDAARSGLRAQAEGLARDVAAQALGRPLS